MNDNLDAKTDAELRPRCYTYADANREFMASVEMRKLSDPTTLGANADKRQYLENRLLEAFRFGITVGERIAADRIAAIVRGEPNP